MFNQKKYDKLFALMEENDMDAIMVAPSSDMEYLVGYHAHLDERLNCLVLLKDRRYFHIVPMINHEEASKKYPTDVKFYVWSDGDGFLDTVAMAFKEHDLDGKCVGVNEGIRAIDVLDFMGLLDTGFVNAHAMMEDYRIIKSDEELENLKKAGQLADEVMVAIKDFIKPGMLESEIQAEIIRLFKEKKDLTVSFSPIVATGQSSSMPHYNEGTRAVQVGDSIVIDFGCKYKNVCSDTSRTFFVGQPSDFQRKIYEICKQATFAAQAHVRAGVTAGEVDKIARDIIDGQGYQDNFLNRTGHGIGFSVHEAPYIKPNSQQVLEDGMAFSIEPGIYIPGKFGMRVENIIILENGLGVSVNHSPVDIEDLIIPV